MSPFPNRSRVRVRFIIRNIISLRQTIDAMKEPFVAMVLLHPLASKAIPCTCTDDPCSIVMILLQNCEASLAVVDVPIGILIGILWINEEEHLR